MSTNNEEKKNGGRVITIGKTYPRGEKSAGQKGEPKQSRPGDLNSILADNWTPGPRQKIEIKIEE